MQKSKSFTAKPLRILTLSVGLFLLTACGASIGSIEPPKIASVPKTLTLPCEGPVELPFGDMTQQSVELYWIRDRVNLLTCGDRLLALVSFYSQRDQLITGPQ